MLGLAIGFGLLIGLVVGTVGGGGAILALPVFVYVLDEGIGTATTASLIVVALAASFGAGANAVRGRVCWRLALTFSAPAAAGAYVGTAINGAIGGRALIAAFIPVMLVAAVVTYVRGDAESDEQDDGCPEVASLRAAGAGLGVGAMTGLFGVGGGFLIIPVLTAWFSLSMRRAIATSLSIITLTGIAALVSHLAAGAAPDWSLTLAVSAAAAAGAVGGTFLSGRLRPELLARSFAVVVALVALFLLLDITVLGGPPTS